MDYSSLMAGQQAASGSVTWTTTAAVRHRFQLTVRGANPAATQSDVVEVAVNGPPPDFGVSFAITPGAGTLGKPVTFTWDAQNAERVLAQPYLPSNEGTFTVLEGAAATDLSTSATATALPLTGDDLQVVLPFPADFKFPFYGEDFTEARVSVNGFVGFGAGHDISVFSANSALGGASQRGGFVAPFWDDLKMYPTSGAYWELVGTAPDRALVIQWNKVGFYTYGAEQDAELTFQAVLHERGETEFRYLALTALSETREGEIRGLQGHDRRPEPALARWQLHLQLQPGDGDCGRDQPADPAADRRRRRSVQLRSPPGGHAALPPPRGGLPRHGRLGVEGPDRLSALQGADLHGGSDPRGSRRSRQVLLDHPAGHRTGR